MKLFYFHDIQKSPDDDNKIIVQGHCNERLMKDADIKALVRVGGKWKSVPVKYSIRKVGPTLWIIDGGRNYSYFASFFVDMGEYLREKKGILRLLFSNPNKTDSDKEEIIFERRFAFVHDQISKGLYNLDEVSVKDGVVNIQGWAAETKEIKVYKIVDRHPVRIKAEISRYNRSDVAEIIAGFNDEEDVGFVINLKTDENKILIRFIGEKTAVVELNLSEYSSDRTLATIIKDYSGRVKRNLRTIGFVGTAKKVVNKIVPVGKPVEISYEKWLEEVAPSNRELDQQRKDKRDDDPKFSILVPLYKTPEKMLKELVESIKAQTYDKFEVILSDGSPVDSVLEKCVKAIVGDDPRFKYVRKGETSLGISDNTNQALAEATGDYIVLGDHDDLFAPNALYECVLVTRQKESDNLVIYSDEDKVDESGKKFSDPHFKPDYNLDLLRSVNYICHMFVASRSLANRVGGFRSEYDGAQDYDFIFRCVEQAETIHHIPKILYHWRSSDTSTATNPQAKMYAFEAGQKAIEAHYSRLGIDAEVSFGDNLGYYNTKYIVKGSPLVSIIIPNKDHIDDLKKCIDSIDKLSTYKNIEYIIVENNSEQQETFKYYDELSDRDDVKVVYWKGMFNYSAINNFGAQEASGEYYLLLNNDIEMINPEAIEHMLGCCQREEVGIVGARLYYPDDTLQHAGTLIGILGVAGHAFQRLGEGPGQVYFNRSKMTADFSAVTAACLMTPKSVFDAVGGLDEKYKVAFNDIDFCLRVREIDKLVVYDAEATFYHYESKSRGYEDTPEKKARFRNEILMFQDRWKDILENGDPYYNPNLTLDRQDYSLR